MSIETSPDGYASGGLEILGNGPDAPVPGAHATGDGVLFAVFAENAERVELCLFDADGTETARLTMPERDGGLWNGFVPGLDAGARYGYRVHGPYAPADGHRFNANKLLIDPYARELAGAVVEHPALYGYDPEAPEKDLSFSTLDSAAYVPKSVVVDDDGDDAPARPLHPFSAGLVYEAHLKGLTQTFPGLADGVRGTVEALAEPALVAHLSGLGVTTLELMPVHAFVDDGFLVKRGLGNYWGYNSIAFLAPEPRYLGPAGRAGFKRALATLRDAGIEVVLDVVYNHTAEADHLGPTLSFRGLDNATYYRLDPDDPGRYVNDTGCGNTLNAAHPQVLRLILDSLRHWVTAYGVAGFRFDLAPALARTDAGFDPMGAVLSAIRQDPVLGQVKLIAEPWDLGPDGYRLGGFPAPFAEWNDRFRDDVRRFWRGDGGIAPLAARLLGSAEIFDFGGRRPWASVNMISAHDGFTLADVVAYARKHNQANGERNRDGHDENFSDNLGHEGPTDDTGILAARARRRRNLMASLFLAQGAPMLLGGDEAGNSQAGNNNAYCQDNEIGWIDWRGLGDGFHDFVARLSGLRQRHPVLRQPRFLHGNRRPDGAPDVEWLPFEGDGLTWEQDDFRRVACRLRGAAEAPSDTAYGDQAIVAVNGGEAAATLALPDDVVWRRVLDTADPDADAAPAAGAETVAGDSIVVFVREDADGR